MARLKLKQINPQGTLDITGSFSVAGETVFYQTNSAQAALIVSGAMEIVKSTLPAQTVSASLSIENLGTLPDRSSSAELDVSDGDDF